MRLSRGQQLLIVLGVWVLAAIAAGADLRAATSVATLAAVVVIGVLVTRSL
jgi:hypothetical protein